MVQSLFGLLFYALLVTHYPTVYGKDEKLASFDRLKSLGFKSRVLPADQGVHCVSYYARTWGSQVGTLQTRLEDAATGKTTLVFSKIRRITTNTSLIFFDVPEQKKPFKVGAR
ncbi:hypothetical protein RRG08_048237 [Elysia crispata]|uniref:Uncharacterized protein n=1 Tax=Elysia crispata TaxID=231223 RepID=A0AAE1A3K8_9GAST|nr:hypothetical protein RRG08_048237 [Elysia crispata]